MDEMFKDVVVPADLQEQMHTDVEHALKALYDVCEKYGLPMHVTVITAARGDGVSQQVSASCSRYHAADTLITLLQALVHEGDYKAAVAMLLTHMSKDVAVH